MHIILRYSNGQRVDGVLLSATDTHLRFVVPDMNETLELHRDEDRWMSEQDTLVELESITWDGRTAIPHTGEPKAHTAAG